MSGCVDVDEYAIKEYESTWVDVFVSDEDINAYWETQRQYGRMKRSNLETFLHAFAVVCGFFNPAENNMADLPAEYKKVVTDMDIQDLEGFLKKLHDYAGVYKDYFSDEDSMYNYNDYVGRVFNVCNALEVSTFYPYFLKQLYLKETELITEEELRKNLFEIERYIVLNAICKGSTKNYNNECLQLVDDKKSPREIADGCIYISEGNFTDGLRRMTTNKLPTLLLFWLELYERNSLNVDVKSLKYYYTLEHIMPQKWRQNWSNVPAYDLNGNEVEDLDDVSKVRNRAIYEIGNMTLLNSKLNTSISNSAFLEKVNGKQGRKGIKNLADLRLTREVIDNNTEWNEQKIYNRTAAFEQKIREIWDAEVLPKETAVKSISGGDRKEIRKEFWTHALPIIREYNNNECYSNTGTTTSNECNGFIGISGFRMVCTANYEGASVCLMLAKSESEKNKKAFDTLAEHKEEIESEVGAKLSWARGEGYKSSWIIIHLKNVSITNKDDWDNMAGFMGEWSNKIRRATLPYLQGTLI